MQAIACHAMQSAPTRSVPEMSCACVWPVLMCRYKDAVFSATAHAPRFKVQPGEAIIVDNYNLWHIREGFTSLERKSWRVWMWKEGDCYGVADTQRTAYRKYPLPS